MACKLCGVSNGGHNAATCGEGQAAIGLVVKVGRESGRPTCYLKITRRSTMGTIASCFVLWDHKDLTGESQALREAKRIQKLTGWGDASVAMYGPDGAITVLVEGAGVATIPEENEHEIAIGREVAA